MTETIAAIILNEGGWFFASMLFSFVVVLLSFRGGRLTSLGHRSEILRAMNLFYGCLIGTMAFGHLLAVTVKLAQGNLEGAPLLLYPLGLTLAIPAWWLAFGAARYASDEQGYGNHIIRLNALLVVLLLAFGVANIPLAVPGVLNIVYRLNAKRAIGWTIVALEVVFTVALLVGSLVFLASGQTFEQFQGMP